MGRRLVSGRSLVALILALGVLAACGEPVATPPPVYFRIAGSAAMAPVVGELVSAFTGANPTVSVEVAPYGSLFGLESLQAGEAELAMVSWLNRDAPGFGLLAGAVNPEWEATPIARDALTIVVHPDNPVQGLGLLQLRDLFGGRVDDWAAVGGSASQDLVQPVSREEGAAIRAAFESLAMEELPVTPRAVVMSSGQAVVQYVAEHPEAVGYISMADLSDQVRALRIEGEWPTPETARQGKYPLVHELWLVTAGPVPEAVSDFVAFARSQAGQEIIAQTFAPIR